MNICKWDLKNPLKSQAINRHRKIVRMDLSSLDERLLITRFICIDVHVRILLFSTITSFIIIPPSKFEQREVMIYISVWIFNWRIFLPDWNIHDTEKLCVPIFLSTPNDDSIIFPDVLLRTSTFSFRESWWLSHHRFFPGILSRIFAHRFELCAKLTSICKSNWDGSFMKQYPLFFILVAVKWQNHQRKKSENRRCHNHSTNSNQFHFTSRRFALLKWKWNSCGNHNENRSKAPNTQEGVVVVISIVNIDLYLNLDPFV